MPHEDPLGVVVPDRVLPPQEPEKPLFADVRQRQPPLACQRMAAGQAHHHGLAVQGGDLQPVGPGGHADDGCIQPATHEVAYQLGGVGQLRIDMHMRHFFLHGFLQPRKLRDVDDGRDAHAQDEGAYGCPGRSLPGLAIRTGACIARPEHGALDVGEAVGGACAVAVREAVTGLRSVAMGEAIAGAAGIVAVAEAVAGACAVGMGETVYGPRAMGVGKAVASTRTMAIGESVTCSMTRVGAIARDAPMVRTGPMASADVVAIG